jgi:serine/threonine-protein kinase
MTLIPPGTDVEGRYRVLQLLGEGAMGAVYEADDLTVGRTIALKVLHLRFARSAEVVRRFAREAQAAASIGHPHIVSVTDFGTHDERPFLVMELLRGETLGARLARELSLAPAEACAVVGQVLSALAAAHAIGVVHRDLKPDNVFLCEGSGAVKLLDFGVSKFHPPGEGAALVTQDGVPIGTPSYMAPEQWTGQRDVDLRADLYAMGAMLYELLTGALPFEARSTGQLYGIVVHGTAAPRAPSEVAPDIPAALDAVVLRAVSRDRALRFQTAEDFLDALRPFGATAAVLPVTAARVHFPSSAPPPPLAAPAVGTARVPSATWAAVAVAVVLVVAAAAFALR